MDIKSQSIPNIQVERTSLKDQAANWLRDLIVRGRIAPGSKITERDVAELLHLSRMPARDALMELENEGLVVTKLDGRYVIKLNEQDIRHLFQLRLSLEKLAVELAVENSSPEKQIALDAKVAEMRAAIEAGNSDHYTISDLEMHQLVWRQAGNPYLVNVLNSLIGPIFMSIASQSRMIEDWQVSLRLHEQLAEMMKVKDRAGAVNSIVAHVRHSLELALLAVQK